MNQQQLITLKMKSKTGQVMEIQVAEILEIDGKPYQPAGNVEVLLQHVNHLSGRVAAIEGVLGQFIAQPQG